MSEIHVLTSQNVYLDLYGGSADATPLARVIKPVGTPRTLEVTEEDAPAGANERYRVLLNMSDTQFEGDLEVEWTFMMGGVPVVKTDHLEVVTPYLSLAEVKKIAPDLSDEEAIEVEASARHIINAHTGQRFGYSRKTIQVEGHGEGALRLPERLVKLEGMSTLTAVLNPNTAIVTSDGWYLKKGWSEDVTAIESTNLYFGGDDITNELPGEPGYEKAGHGHVIAAPGSTRPSAWRDDYPFQITGWWGYKTIPASVKEAARLLVNDYACGEALYRDRYLAAVKFSDWRLDFNARTWEATGNVRADQLLAEYVLLDWAVI